MKHEVVRRIDSLKQSLLVSNTPKYLYKHYRHLLSDLQNSYSFSDLYNELIELSKKNVKPDLDTMAYIYGLITLIFYHNYSDVRPYLAKISNLGLRWIKELVSIYTASASISNSMKIQVPLQEPSFSSSTTDNNIAAYVDVGKHHGAENTDA